MKKLMIYLLLILIFVPFSFSCERATTMKEGELSSIELSNLKGIPLEYGTLISVTTHAAYPGWAQLWFEDGNKTIRMVRIGFDSKRVNEKIINIPRY